MTLRRCLQRLTPYLFLTPAMVVTGLILVYPVTYGIGLSFFSWPLREFSKPPKFVGWGNYLELAGNEYFYTSVKVTLIFIGGIMVCELLVGLILALLLEDKMRGLRVFRTIFILPIMIAPVVVGVVWRFLYDPTYGMINYLLGLVGIEPKMWLSDPSLALVSIILTDIWQWTPFVFLILLAGLQGIPQELIEAGKVDGANYFQNLIHIKLPQIRSIMGVTAILRLTDAFRGLEVMYVMTFGGPGMSTQILSLHMYKTAFIGQRLGLASAVGVVLLFFMLLSLLPLLLRRASPR